MRMLEVWEPIINIPWRNSGWWGTFNNWNFGKQQIEDQCFPTILCCVWVKQSIAFSLLLLYYFCFIERSVGWMVSLSITWEKKFYGTSRMLAARIKLSGGDCLRDLCLPVRPREKMPSSSVKKIKKSIVWKSHFSTVLLIMFLYFISKELRVDSFRTKHKQLHMPSNLECLWQCISG
jgi:hypothetical protein